MSYVDGNALAGALSLAFGRDMTTAVTVCGQCGDQHAIAATHVYLRCPGMVIRCPNCSAVEIVLNDRSGHISVHIRSIATLQFQ